MPLHGARAAEGRAVADGARLAMGRATEIAGGVRIRVRYLDDTGGAPRWSPVATAANARRAAEDSTSIGFIGDLDSGATRVSLPITNQAEIPQVSPGSTALDLTGERYRPSGAQTFARIVPNDAVLRRGAAALARRLGVAASAVRTGSAPPRPPRECIAAAAERYIVSPYREPFRLGPRGKPFNRAYRARFDQPQPASAYGYEAMSLLLSSIRRAGSESADRESVAAEVLATRGRRSVIGDYSLEDSGDTTLRLVTAYSIDACRLAYLKELRVPAP